jgi:hypothetical protein
MDTMLSNRKLSKDIAVNFNYLNYEELTDQNH